MIVSASRRTDIPAFYSEWLMNRIKAGTVTSRNPFNAAQMRKVSLLPEDVDCFVFWTKDPINMLDKLPAFDEMGFQYYFQFTLTPYNSEVERHLRDKSEIIKTFVELSKRIGKERNLWRYDPIILNEELNIEYHCKSFERMCDALADSTTRVAISFVDLYKKIKTDLIREVTENEMIEIAARFSEIARQYTLPMVSCCEALDFSPIGIGKSACVDKNLVEHLTGRVITEKPDKSQRAGCCCAKSVDIGIYNTCASGCVYCYANHSESSILKNMQRHDSSGEMLLP